MWLDKSFILKNVLRGIFELLYSCTIDCMYFIKYNCCLLNKTD